jgi:hypothetical protein
MADLKFSILCSTRELKTLHIGRTAECSSFTGQSCDFRAYISICGQKCKEQAETTRSSLPNPLILDQENGGKPFGDLPRSSPFAKVGESLTPIANQQTVCFAEE